MQDILNPMKKLNDRMEAITNPIKGLTDSIKPYESPTLDYYNQSLDFGIKVSLMGISLPVESTDSTLGSNRKISLDITGEEFIIMQAKTFPLINLLWLGCILMLLGSVMAVFFRLKRSK